MKHNRSWVEPGKTLLLVALSLSALYLFYLSPLFQGSPLLGLLREDAPTPSAAVRLSAPVTPARMMVSNGSIRSGLLFESGELNLLFRQTAPLLGEALRTASTSSSVSQQEWQTLLSGAGLYFDFLSPLPLSVLCGWLQSEEGNPALTHSARHLFLAPRWDGSVLLGYQSGEEFYLSVTGLDATLHLEPILADILPNGAYFAYQHSQMSDRITPLTLFSGTHPDLPVYVASHPDLSPNSPATIQLLQALAFSGQNSAPISNGQVYADGEDTLRIYHNGEVVYHAAQSEKYLCRSTDLDGVLDMVWTLAEAALEPLSGSGRLYLSHIDSRGEHQYTISLGYQLNGCPVQLYADGWTAQFTVEHGVVVAFTLRPRTYANTGQTALLLPQEKAVAALEVLSDQPLELLIQYPDDGSALLNPRWVGKSPDQEDISWSGQE